MDRTQAVNIDTLKQLEGRMLDYHMGIDTEQLDRVRFSPSVSERFSLKVAALSASILGSPTPCRLK